MKKGVLLACFATSLLFGAPHKEITLPAALQDSKKITAFTKEHLRDLLNDTKKLKELLSQIKQLNKELQQLSSHKENSFHSPKKAQKALENIERLSSEALYLAKTTAFLASHHANTTDQKYLDTLLKLTHTTKKLSQEIHTFSQHTITAASKIKELQNKALKTQKQESRHYRSASYLCDAAERIIKRQSTITKENAAHPTIPKSGGYAF